jgi:hypothetical protein
MPNRIIREGFLDSDAISNAGEAAEVLFTRLLLVADDYGRFDGRVTVICRRCWPNGGPNEESIRERLRALVGHELVVMYEVDGKPYLFIPNFKQRSRAMKSKYPPPPVENLSTTIENLSTAEKTPVEENPSLNNNLSNDGQMPDKRQSGDIHPRTYSDSDSYSIRARKAPTETPKPAAQSTAKAREVIEENRKAAETAAPMPKHIAERFVRKPGKVERPP